MMSARLMIALGVAYVVIIATALLERNWPRALYFLGAVLITVAILWMGQRADFR